jgi:chemotaxis signal transduction protein
MHSQKILIYRAQDGMFAIKVDGIKDIIAIDDETIKSYSHQAKVGACLHTRGVVEYKKSLVVVIDTVK